MTESGYAKIAAFFKRHNALFIILKIIYKYLSYPVYVAYPVLVIYLLYQTVKGNCGINDLLKVILIPAVTFFAVTALRLLINAPRPYEKLNVDPLFIKNTKGKSFPSRHSASVFIIAMAFMYVNLIFGAILFFIGIIMCISRVLAGVHFVRDVAAGAVFSIILGTLFWIL